MAQRAKTTATTKTSATGRRPGRPLGSKAKPKPAPTPAARKVGRPAVAKSVAAARKPAAASATLKAGAAPAKRRPGRPPGSKAKAVPAPTAVKTRRAVVAKPAAAARKAPAISAATVGKVELQAQIEKLERTVATLRTRSREAVRTAKAAAARIEELEGQLAQKEQAPEPAAAAPRVTKQTRKDAAVAPPETAAKPAKSPRGRRPSPERDPGDAVPPGVAVQEPEPMDEEATAAFDSLEATLHPVEE